MINWPSMTTLTADITASTNLLFNEFLPWVWLILGIFTAGVIVKYVFKKTGKGFK